jgi:hypothetical protein
MTPDLQAPNSLQPIKGATTKKIKIKSSHITILRRTATLTIPIASAQ